MTKMRRVFLILSLAFVSVGAFAQNVYSHSESNRSEKKKVDNIYFKIGPSFMTYRWSEGEQSLRKAGYELIVGFQKKFGTKGLYWGAEGGFSSSGFRHARVDEYEQSEMRHSILISPAIVGYKQNLTERISFDAHLELYASVDYAGKTKYEEEEQEEVETKMGDWKDFSRFDMGLRMGLGLWYDRYNLDLTWQRGFISRWDDKYYDCSMYTSNIMLRLGISF